MLYLIGGSWGWLLTALLIGAAVGWATTTLDKGKELSAGPVWAALGLAAASVFAAYLEIAPGRTGLAFDLGALMLAAYALGLPLGGGAKLKLAPAEEPAPKRAPVIVVKGASPPPAQAAPSSAHDAVEAAPPSPPSPPKKTAPARERTPASPARKQLPGARPQGLAQPRGGKPDDLTKIKGIGPKSAEKLHALGVWHYDQIAAWTPDNLEWIGSWLALPGRIDRGVWVTQAKNLASRAPQDGEQDEAKAD